ncbi:excalibur calcium-binding domain-containing protein [Acuticoccus sp. 2012]|uniref:Excalibur calcium-binding domain-containing protein n=1 Tax=Acuticoccus mangrovi TaxID=2796142 RepID=A0A934IN56_9HYPH|nr:excalibur calcium-binding domain-containing protein [Acuticoccus mangrovi]
MVIGYRTVVVALVFSLVAIEAAEAARCTDYASCRQAVVAWCRGAHPRADGDGDGIPCENVCRSRAQVVAIMREIGCNR